MTPPTSIDGTDISGATIDGQEVQAISLDGQDVFTASDPRVYFVGGYVSGYSGPAGLEQVTEVNPKNDSIINYDDGMYNSKTIYPATRLVSHDKVLYAIFDSESGDEPNTAIYYFDPVASDPNDSDGAVSDRYNLTAPYIRPGGPATAMLGDRCYFVGGDQNNQVGYIDFGTNQIDSQNNILPYNLSFTVGEAVQGSIYTLGGDHDGPPYTLDKIYKFDPPNNITEMGATMPFEDAEHSSTMMDDKIYVLQSYGKRVFEYDPIADTIANLPDFPYTQIRSNISSALGNLYVAVGYRYGNNSGESNDIYKLNLASGNWSRIGGSGRATRGGKTATKIDFAE